MRNYMVKSIFATILLSMVLVPMPVKAADLGMTLRVTPSTTTPGTTVGVVGVLTNNTSSKVRTTVTFTSVDPCGVETAIGYNRLQLDPGFSIIVTATYPIPADACKGTYTITMTAKTSGGSGKNSGAASIPSTTTTLTVQ